jgi:hypothetical protein
MVKSAEVAILFSSAISILSTPAHHMHIQGFAYLVHNEELGLCLCVLIPR